MAIFGAALSRAGLLAISNRPREEIIFPYIQFRNGFNQRKLSIIHDQLSINERLAMT
ncbi:hypothetical protein [Okeania sp. SIO2C2]|uniref:hypothetical protein n=1 Tax=Okeania sp. SIO2C2 TaxID=2607787 RepID=UPI00257B1353|nr:hypothetical protein [Okeania sp. SIO2C2]